MGRLKPEDGTIIHQNLTNAYDEENKYVIISDEVKKALRERRPIVALESTGEIEYESIL